MLYVNIGILLYSIAATSILLTGCLMEYTIRKRTTPYFIPCVICTLVMEVVHLIQWLTVSGNSDTSARASLHRASYMGYIISYYILLILFTRFLICVIKKMADNARIPVWVDRLTVCVCGVSAGCWCMNLSNDAIVAVSADGIVWGPLYFVGQAGGFVVLAVIVAIVVRYRKGLGIKNSLVLLSFVVFPVSTVIMRPFYTDLSLMAPAIALSLALVHYYLNIRQTIFYQQKETRLTKERIDLMLSQISPHFVFNTLNSIYYLCDEDPELAKQSISDFAEHLRANIYFLENCEPVPMKKEMENVVHYLSLERMRFQDELDVIFDLQYTNFLIPPLTIQPLVENAVQYGATMNENGGYVRIGSYLREDHIEVVVSDNGPGFEMPDEPEDDLQYAGLRNIRERLQDVLNADLIVESVVGKGSRVTIQIPLESMTTENNDF